MSSACWCLSRRSAIAANTSLMFVGRLAWAARPAPQVVGSFILQRRARTYVVAAFAAGFLAPAALVALAALAAVFRCSEVWAPNFLLNRSTRPSVSISFCRPVRNGWHAEQISRCSSGLVERVLNVLPHAQRTSTSLYLG